MSNRPLDKILKEWMEKSDAAYASGDYLKSVAYLIEAWEALPVPKYAHVESYHIVYYICETYLQTAEKEKAQTWVEKIFLCDLTRFDDGDREFLAGKVAFELGDLNRAKMYFNVANEKSEGRCFLDEDEKFKAFYLA